MYWSKFDIENQYISIKSIYNLGHTMCAFMHWWCICILYMQCVHYTFNHNKGNACIYKKSSACWLLYGSTINKTFQDWLLNDFRSNNQLSCRGWPLFRRPQIQHLGSQASLLKLGASNENSHLFYWQINKFDMDRMECEKGGLPAVTMYNMWTMSTIRWSPA